VRGQSVWQSVCNIMIFVCWQAWRWISEWTAVGTNKDCHDAELRKQHLEYHNSWDYWYFTLLVLCLVLHCVNIDSAYWLWWKPAATYCNAIRCHRFGMVLQTDSGRSTPCRTPANSTANNRVTVDSTCLHYLIFHRKFWQSVCWRLVFCYTDVCVDRKRFITGAHTLFLQNISVPHLPQINYQWHKVTDGRNRSARTI